MIEQASQSLRVLSLGAGVQSSTLLLLAVAGELERPAAAIFADTGWEPAAVYRHLEWLTGVATAAGIPVERVSLGNLRDDALAGKPNAWMPAFAHNQRGETTMLRRQCTNHYKLRPIRRCVRKLLREHRRKLEPGAVEQWLGLSFDEVVRMRPSGVEYVRNRYPLIERRWTRADCLRWLREQGYPTPPKSSCIGCPYHDAAYWRALRDTSPAEWQDAVEFDAAIRRRGGRYEGIYLHRSCVPLAEVDLTTPPGRAQQPLGDDWDDECLGMCGV